MGTVLYSQIFFLFHKLSYNSQMKSALVRQCLAKSAQANSTNSAVLPGPKLFA